MDTLLYPIVDGPGVALLVTMPFPLAIMTLPLVDLFATITDRNALNPVNLILLPVAMPMVFGFGFLFGYIMLFLGRVMAASAFGEDDHPRWPVWDNQEIADGLGRWIWASLFGLIVGGYPAMAYWINCGQVDYVDWFIFGDLVILGASYGQMALAAALLHENILAANPIAVLLAIFRLGWDYVVPAVMTGICVTLTFMGWVAVLYHAPNTELGALGLWFGWVVTLYEAIVVFRVLGLMYHKHTETLDWFRKPPYWGT